MISFENEFFLLKQFLIPEKQNRYKVLLKNNRNKILTRLHHKFKDDVIQTNKIPFTLRGHPSTYETQIKELIKRCDNKAIYSNWSLIAGDSEFDRCIFDLSNTLSLIANGGSSVIALCIDRPILFYKAEEGIPTYMAIFSTASKGTV